MAAAIIFINFFLTVFVVRRFFNTWRGSIVAALCMTGAWIIVSTEVLSLFHAISFAGVFIAHVCYALVLLSVLIKYPQVFKFPTIAVDRAVVFMVVLIGVMAALNLLTIMVSMPNTWDAMTYHLPRIIAWEQLHAVCNYPTDELRQLYYAPASAIVLLHGYVLAGTLDYAGILQWVSYLGCMLTVSLLVSCLGGSFRAQVFAAFLVAVLPMAVLQAVSTQNHLMAAMWTVIAIYLMHDMRKNPTAATATILGVALGLGLLTKESVILFIAPFLIWFLISLAKYQRAWFIKTGGIILVSILVINAGHWYRQYQLYQLNVESTVSVTNESISLTSTAANLLRNAAINVDMPFVSQWAKQAVHGIAKFWHIPLDDPRSTFGQVGGFEILFIPFDEDYAACFPFILLVLLAIVVGWFNRRKINNRPLIVMLLLMMAGMVLFSAVVKFQPWHMRFQMTLWILMIVIIAMWLQSILRSWALGVLIVLFCAGGILTIGMNRQHPWLGGASIWQVPRIAQMYYKKGLNRYVAEKAIMTALTTMNCSKVGFLAGGDTWTYPMQRQIKEIFKEARWVAVGVSNRSQQLMGKPEDICAIVGFNAYTGAININGIPYDLAWQTTQQPVITVYVPQ